ncbi:MAG: bifunctional phosphoribosylaminoimidazolecarboxamide formyltransferase/IMP cyclohydrolase [Treponema sp.]|nr:bifunctional phosphoribosylaminoimidazolecarboxamide formyltransferase/IMP cyclohydrolase [Treponema sp.]
MKKRALISVFEKNGILELASFLNQAGWEIISTGGTAKHLKENGVPVISVSSVTGFPECLDGRVKTLHPAIHAGILAKRNEPAHRETLEKQGFSLIDMVCINLYPFFDKVQSGLPFDETIEFIDIGGPALLRSAAKNFCDVIALTDPSDYAEVIAQLKTGSVSEVFRKKLAGKVFNLTSAYDAAISRYLLDETYPSYWTMSFKKAHTLRYGENSHQSATLYLDADDKGALGTMTQIHGKELSYNNIRDLDLAWKTACSFGLGANPAVSHEDVERLLPNLRFPSVCCVAVKHNTPCGVSLADNLAQAYAKTHACDPVSIFGGIVACNVPIDADTAAKLSDLFLEIIVAPDFEDSALEILKQKKNIRIMRAPFAPGAALECISVDGGLLVQETDCRLMEKWDVVTKVQPDERDIADMVFGMRAVHYVKSNAVVAVKDLAAIGIGAGETNRIWAAELALSRSGRVIEANAKVGGDGRPARVLASDAFFPFPDVVEAAAAAGVKAIIQPGGSVKDDLSIEACNDLGVAMVFTGTRHFKH